MEDYNKDKLGEQLKNEFNKSFSNLVKEKCQSDNVNGEKKTAISIADDLGITYQALINYQKNRLPEYKQLAFIKQYFDVSYSFLFGETKTKNINDKNIKLDLSNVAIKKLSLISSKSKENDIVSSSITYMLENLIIENDNDILKSMSYLMILNAIKKYSKDITDDYIEYIEYKLTKKIIKYIQNMSKNIKVPKEILISTYEKLKNDI